MDAARAGGDLTDSVLCAKFLMEKGFSESIKCIWASEVWTACMVGAHVYTCKQTYIHMQLLTHKYLCVRFKLFVHRCICEEMCTEGNVYLYIYFLNMGACVGAYMIRGLTWELPGHQPSFFAGWESRRFPCLIERRRELKKGKKREGLTLCIAICKQALVNARFKS